MAGSKPDKQKAADGMVSAPQACRIADVPLSTLTTWLRAGVIEPTNAANATPGVGNHRRFDLRDLTSIIVVSELRRRGVHFSKLRRIQSTLREEHGEDWASCRLALVNRADSAPADVVLLRTERERKRLAYSLLESPGQSVLAEVDLRPVVREARKGFRAALREKPAVRGWPKGRKKEPGTGRAASREVGAGTG